MNPNDIIKNSPTVVTSKRVNQLFKGDIDKINSTKEFIEKGKKLPEGSERTPSYPYPIL